MTAELLARCREALHASDEAAQGAGGAWALPKWSDRTILTSLWAQDEADPADRGQWAAIHVDPPELAAFVLANDPATRLALNAALRTVLDGIEGTIFDAVPCDCPDCDGEPWSDDYHRATASLAAIATALGVQEVDRG